MSVRLRWAQQVQRTLEQSGGTVSTSLELFDKGNQEIGFRARKNISAFECLVSVPYELCVIECTERQSEVRATQRLVETLLIREKCYPSSSSSSSPSSSPLCLTDEYMNLLPTRESMKKTFPSFWDENEWKYLRNTSLFHLQTTKTNELRDIYRSSRLFNNYNDTSFSLEDFIWADNIVSSRCFGQNKAKAVVPFLDLVNHSSKVNTEPLGSTGGIVVCGPGVQSEEAYNLFAMGNIKQGDEVCISYGELSPETSLIGYGFNPFEGGGSHVEDARVALKDINPGEGTSSRGEDNGFNRNIFHLALPVVPSLSKRGRLTYLYETFEFIEDQYDERIADLLEAGVDRQLLGKVIKRRIKTVQSILSGYHDEPQGSTGKDLELQQTQLLVVQAELAHLKNVNNLLEYYDLFLCRQNSILDNRHGVQTEQYKNVLAYAHLFKENTGIDIIDELIQES